MFGFNKKAKMAIRNKIIITYLDNYILTHNGVDRDEWGNTWIEKSFNDIISFYKANETKPNIVSKFDLVPMRIMNLDLNEEYIYAPYKVLFQIYFGKEPSMKEMDILRQEFKKEKHLRNIEIKMQKIFISTETNLQFNCVYSLSAMPLLNI